MQMRGRSDQRSSKSSLNIELESWSRELDRQRYCLHGERDTQSEEDRVHGPMSAGLDDAMMRTPVRDFTWYSIKVSKRTSRSDAMRCDGSVPSPLLHISSRRGEMRTSPYSTGPTTLLFPSPVIHVKGMHAILLQRRESRITITQTISFVRPESSPPHTIPFTPKPKQGKTERTKKSTHHRSVE